MGCAGHRGGPRDQQLCCLHLLLVLSFARDCWQVLCFELLAKKNRTWTLHYTAGAVAETDVPETLLELIKQVPTGGCLLTCTATRCCSSSTLINEVRVWVLSCAARVFFQRRRWLNGSFFSLIYYVTRFHNLLSRSDHSWFRRIGLLIQFCYQVSMLLLSWFGVGSLYLSLVVILQLAVDSLQLRGGDQLMWTFALLYSFLTLLQVRAVVMLYVRAYESTLGAQRWHENSLWFRHVQARRVLLACAHLAMSPPPTHGAARVSMCASVYLGVCVYSAAAQLLLGLGSKPGDTIKIYFICSLGFGAIMTAAVILSLWQLITGR